jgi:multimeric flavodoxin WrbA
LKTLKVILVNGSPHQKGCTFTALHEIQNVLTQQKIDTEIFNIGTKPVEGLQIMRTLGNNMAWLLKCIQLGKENGIELPQAEAWQRTNFIR